jgi:hypothetical protein
MRIFVQTFEGEVGIWFKGLPHNSIDSWDALESSFLRQWGEKKDHLYFLTEFGNLKKKQNDYVPDFIKRFNKIYNKILAYVKPSQPVAKVTFVDSFDLDFALFIRERRSTTLIGMRDDVVEMKSNTIASRKTRIRSESRERDKIKQKEQVGASETYKSQEDKIEEMSRIIKDLSNKFTRMKNERRRPDNKNPNKFRRYFNPPQVFKRERINEDQPIQAPIKNEKLVDNLIEEGFEDTDEEINIMEGDISDVHVTQEEYEKSLSFNSYFNEYDNNIPNDTSSSEYRICSDVLQEEFHRKYDLRPRTNVNTTKTNNQGHPDKVLNKDKGKKIAVSKKLI